MLFPESSLNGRPSTLLILDHVLTTTYNNRPHLTTFFGDCFDDFNKSGNQLGFNSLIASNKHTIIPAFHQHLSSRPGHEESQAFCLAFSVVLEVLAVNDDSTGYPVSGHSPGWHRWIPCPGEAARIRNNPARDLPQCRHLHGPL